MQTILLAIVHLTISKFYIIVGTLCLYRTEVTHRIKRRKIIFGYMVGDFILSYLFWMHTYVAFYVYILHLITTILLYNFCSKYNIIGVTGSLSSGKSAIARKVVTNYKEIAMIDCQKIYQKLFTHDRLFIYIIRILFRDIDLQYRSFIIDPKVFTKIVRKQQNLLKVRMYFILEYIFMSYHIIQKIVYLFVIRNYELIIIDSDLLIETRLLKCICFPIVTIYNDKERDIIPLVEYNNNGDAEEKENLLNDVYHLNSKTNKTTHKTTKFDINKKINLSDVSIEYKGNIQLVYCRFISWVIRNKKFKHIK